MLQAYYCPYQASANLDKIKQIFNDKMKAEEKFTSKI